MTTNKPIKILAKDRILTDVLTLAIVLTVIGTICVAIVPGTISDTTKINGDFIITTIHTSLHGPPDIPVVGVNDSIVIAFPDQPEPTEIQSLIADITWTNPADKAQYAHHPDSADDVHVCVNMAVEQAEWIIENYDYDVGIVMLHNRYIGDNHVQTWVDVNGTRYIIDSTSNYYWTEEEHVDHWKDRYGIQYTNLEKGRELEKDNNELINNKDEPILDDKGRCGSGGTNYEGSSGAIPD